jgi:hypothetical protein
MESISKKEDDRPTTSTGGIPDNELAIVSLKTQPEVPVEEEKVPVVDPTTLPPLPEKGAGGPEPEMTPVPEEGEAEESYIDTAIRRRSTHEPSDYEAASAERHLRDSVQIQAPFPPEDESDAFVVSPTPPTAPSPAPQIAIQTTSEPEQTSEVDDVPRPFTTFDDGQPKVPQPPTQRQKLMCRVRFWDLCRRVSEDESVLFWTWMSV